jgi:DNA-binding helix-hairpin-helix protein with protein kinase domain
MTTGMLIETVDGSGNAVLLSDVVGKGGEGSVFEVIGAPKLVAKVYHQTPIVGDQLAKLEAMIAQRSAKIDGISAWPTSLLFNPHRREPCGILMPRVMGARHLHELYGTANRRMHFPDAQWHHLVLAARNVAAAFDTMHEAGILVGDVNQGNLLVDEQMCVRFIDCDSFQITADGRTFPCPVGTPHFTPPELQGKKLRNTPREAEHDLFGMAVLLFHLIFVGRHPFAGRFHGAGDLTVERAIAERRFAFSRDRAATRVDPPPASLLLDDIPPALGALFERAFRKGSSGAEPRPTAAEFAEQLELLIKQRKACSFEPAHVYSRALPQCPWCRIEDVGGPAFFISSGSATMISRDRLSHLEAKLNKLVLPEFPVVSPQQLKVPQALKPARGKMRAKFGGPDLAVTLLAASAGLCVGGRWSSWSLAAGAVGSIVAGAWLLLGGEAKSRRRRAVELTQKLDAVQRQLYKQAQSLLNSHRQRQFAFDGSLEQLKEEIEHFHAADKQLPDVMAVHRTSEKTRFLGRHLIQDHVASIPGMTFPAASVLQSYGIESAADVESLKLLGIPMLSPGLTLELITWREGVERQFSYKPEHAISFDQAAQGGQAATMRFKGAFARRILMAAAQLASVAKVADEQVASQIGQFEQAATGARALARELRDELGGRRLLERLLNRSPWEIVGAALGVPAVGLVLWLLFG